MSIELAKLAIKEAIKQGATHAEALFAYGESQEVRTLNGQLESFNTAISDAIGLRVLVGNKQASGRTSVLTTESVAQLSNQITAMARSSTEDNNITIATEQQLCRNWKDISKKIEIYDPKETDISTLQTHAQEVEAKGLNNKGISKSGGSWAEQSRGGISLITSTGFEGSYQSSSFGFGVTLLAGGGQQMVRDSAYSFTRFFDDLKSIETIAQEAAEKTLGKVGAAPVSGGKLPVIFERRAAASLLGHFLSAINGESVSRGASFLKDALNEEIFSKTINIMETPHLKRGLSSRPFDGEGLPATPEKLVGSGILNSFLLDLSSAKKLNLAPNGHAVRSLASPPHPGASNCYIEKGALSAEELMADIKRGFLVTNFIGNNLSLITGEYSRGFSGFLIENGKISKPVHEMTIAGNLKDMFKQITAANDLQLEHSLNTPTLRIENMTVAGK